MTEISLAAPAGLSSTDATPPRASAVPVAEAAEAAIILSGVGKVYPSYRSRMDRMQALLLGHRWTERSHFVALADIDLIIRPGETVGLLGVNGAGKSTLLQLIAGTIRPSAGRVVVNGSVAALLELGSGFNPDWTGRQNAAFQCRMSGLDRSQFKERMARIEDFADVGGFFDQPMRTYSSGMYMRVAFAAAITVDPDILIVDEALAVGDARFQAKCFARFQEFQSQGRTILFVSHSADLVGKYCTRGILLDKGRVVFDGQPPAAINRFMELMYGRPGRGADAGAGPGGTGVASALGPQPFDRADRSDRLHLHPRYNPSEHRYGAGQVRIIDAMILREGEPQFGALRNDDEIRILLRIAADADVANCTAGLVLKTVDGVRVYGTSMAMQHQPTFPLKANGDYVLEIALRLPLYSGDYFVDLAISEYFANEYIVQDARQSVLHLTIVSDLTFNGILDLDARFSEPSQL